MLSPVVGYQVVLAVAVAVCGASAAVAWRHRTKRGGTPFSVLLAAATVWTACNLVGTLFPGTPLAVAANNVVLTAVAVVVPSLFVFALAYSGRDGYLRPATYGLLAVEPVAITVLVWTNEAHGLVYRRIEPGGGSLDQLITIHGPAFHVHTAYSYLLLGAAVLTIVVFALRSKYLYQRQVTAIVVATLAPWAANVISLSTSSPYDFTPPAFAVTGLAFTWAVVRADFLDITPVATEVVVDRIDTAVFVVDDADRLVEVNDSACELFSVSSDEAIGEAAPTMLSVLPNAPDAYRELVRARSPVTREFESGERYFRMQAAPLFERRDELVGYVFLVVDLTEQRRRERELERRNEQLDRFTGVVSHDLRNPLTVAQGRVELLREECDSEHLDAIERSHDRMETLIDDLLTLARQEDSPSTERVRLGDLALTAWDHVATADATLSVETDGAVEADPDRVEQLFENLFRNAVEHGGDDVAVTVTDLPDCDGFAVADDGAGFGDADPEAVFQDGYTTRPGGTGFGLSIVAEVADRHGWSVRAADAETGGARVEVCTDGAFESPPVAERA